jgi:hypothetical protein
MTDDILKAIDKEIGRLQAAFKVLSGAKPKAAAKPTKPAKHKLSAAGRERIAEAQRKRWAKAKK